MRAASVVWTLFVRELKGYFYSPIGYVVAGIFLFLNGFFFGGALQSRLLVTDLLFWRVSALLLFITPMVGMRLVSEELRSGTVESLLTDPVRTWEVVAGKYLGGYVFLGLLFLPLGAFCLFIDHLGRREGGLDPGPVLAGMIGLLLMAAAGLAASMLFSAMTRNQIVAGVLGFVTLLFLYLVHHVAPVVAGRSAWLWGALRYLSLSGHLFRFFRGQLAAEDVVYFGTLAALAVFLTGVALDARRWR